jgi:hypothetical protein
MNSGNFGSCRRCCRPRDMSRMRTAGDGVSTSPPPTPLRCCAAVLSVLGCHLLGCRHPFRPGVDMSRDAVAWPGPQTPRTAHSGAPADDGETAADQSSPTSTPTPPVHPDVDSHTKRRLSGACPDDADSGTHAQCLRGQRERDANAAVDAHSKVRHLAGRGP